MFSNSHVYKIIMISGTASSVHVQTPDCIYWLKLKPLMSWSKRKLSWNTATKASHIMSPFTAQSCAVSKHQSRRELRPIFTAFTRVDVDNPSQQSHDKEPKQITNQVNLHFNQTDEMLRGQTMRSDMHKIWCILYMGQRMHRDLLTAAA